MMKRSQDSEPIFRAEKKMRLEDDNIGEWHLDQNTSNADSGTTARVQLWQNDVRATPTNFPAPARGHSDYTIGLICALSTEMTAVKAVLDEVHTNLAVPSHDENAYTLGRICGHNIVVACLPAGVYGTTAAATVASQMLSTFSSITMRLMVGVGGGVPTKEHDIRLGDVVISIPTPQCSAVVQYDHGKTLADGQFHRTGQLNKPPIPLLTAVNKLQADHRLNASKTPAILSMVFDKYPRMKSGYGYPGQDQDVLYEPGCNHIEEGETCSTCGLLEPIARAPRDDDAPRFHYGPIASGNQVMKHGKTRDRLAQQLGILCFEMEAAGLMDSFPCLIVRGMCDYSDAQKNKQFQNYAALTAAAYARELLSIIPSSSMTPSSIIQRVDSKPNLEHRKLILDSLNFEQAEIRRATIRGAHRKTCHWLLQQADYRDWLDENKTSEHHGLLWIKGKPATGKSTVMKFLLTHVEKTMAKDSISVSFFFNARGAALEKSTTGMYRSLLVQLLEKFPDSLDSLDLPLSGTWDIEVLKKIFCSTLRYLRQKHLLCFVDALDECPEDQVRGMIEFFEDLGRLGTSDQIRLHVCFSSRHYPTISINTCRQLILEDQEGHLDDVSSYLSTELKIGKSKQAQELKDEILEKAGGIFLWVVLVVRILKEEYDRGRMFALRKRLHETPVELDDLFKDILVRDGQNIDELLLCIRWILFAKCPLKREEFYFAILSGRDPQSLNAWDPEEVTPRDMERFVLNCSKGLAEMTRAKLPTVQFIHESVREYLLRKDALANIWPGFQGIAEGPSHGELKDCCYNYMRVDTSGHLDLTIPLPRANTTEAANLRDVTSEKFPFLHYAVHHVLSHADAAEMNGIAQNAFLEKFALDIWIKLANLLQTFEIRRYTHKASLLYICADRDLPNLIKFQPRGPSVLNMTRERYESPLLAAAAHGNENAIKALLMLECNAESPPGSIFSESHFGQVLDDLRGFRCTRPRSWNAQNLFLYMIEHGSTILAKILIDRGVDLGMKHFMDNSPLGQVAAVGREALVELLTERGANIESKSFVGLTPLGEAVESGHHTIVSMLLDKGADVESRSSSSPRPLVLAVMSGNDVIVKLLIDRGAKVESRDSAGCTPLLEAVQLGNEAIIKLLIERGAEVESKDSLGCTPLLVAVQLGNEAIIKLLIESGAKIESKGSSGYTPLHKAEQKLTQKIYLKTHHYIKQYI
ncbi:MAG: hypothetical protein Q9165_006402 [Trypethelium subeluteriae]